MRNGWILTRTETVIFVVGLALPGRWALWVVGCGVEVASRSPEAK
jgi:hypothetical protein